MSFIGDGGVMVKAKSDAVRNGLIAAMEHNFVSKSLDFEERGRVADAMSRVVAGANQTVITEGDATGDHFYIIEEGEYNLI